MELKNLSKKELMEMINQKNSELEELAKNQIKQKKAKFDNIILIKAAFNELLNIDNNIYDELSEQLSLLNSIGDKWNYIAYLEKIIRYIQKNKIDISNIKLKFDNPSDNFAIIKAIFNDKMKIEKNISIPKKAIDYNSIA